MGTDADRRPRRHILFHRRARRRRDWRRERNGAKRSIPRCVHSQPHHPRRLQEPGVVRMDDVEIRRAGEHFAPTQRRDTGIRLSRKRQLRRAATCHLLRRGGRQRGLRVPTGRRGPEAHHLHRQRKQAGVPQCHLAQRRRSQRRAQAQGGLQEHRLLPCGSLQPLGAEALLLGRHTRQLGRQVQGEESEGRRLLPGRVGQRRRRHRLQHQEGHQRHFRL